VVVEVSHALVAAAAVMTSASLSVAITNLAHLDYFFSILDFLKKILLVFNS